MRLLTFTLLAASLYSGAMAQGRCTPGNSYCGSVLISRGWNKIDIHPNAVYYCSSAAVVKDPQICGNGCFGPTAHCG